MDDHSKRIGASRYETDFFTWTQEQAALLREGRVASADLANIVEELETLGRSELASLVSAYELICQHLLKSILQAEKATASWDTTIKREQGKIEDILDDNPGLKARRDEAFAKGYARGRRDAANETGIEISRFPIDPPFTREQAETSNSTCGASRRSSPRAATQASPRAGKTPRP